MAVSDSGVCVGQRFHLGLDTIPPGPVTNFAATPESGTITLSWSNTADGDFTGTIIVYRLDDTYPQGPTDGILVVDKPNRPGSNDSFVHQGLDSRMIYRYAAFAHDGTPNYAEAADATAVPWALGDFNRDRDVDQEDFGYLQVCLSGSLPETGCEDADLDLDLDVDEQDFAIFQSCMGGANNEPGC